MRLPNASKAIVERKKIVDYLLNPAHPDNGGKAQFFDKLKFHRKEWKYWRKLYEPWPARPRWQNARNRRTEKNTQLLAGSHRPPGCFPRELRSQERPPER
jgi:hypothetical protein